MRSFRWLVLIAGVGLIASCRSQQQPATSNGPVPVGTVREVMHGVVETSADVLFESVGITVSEAGTEEREPKTDDDWEKVHSAALTLAEAANLLTIPGRPVAKPEEMNKSFDPSELTPAEIQKKIDGEPQVWLKHVKNLQDVARQAMKATGERNKQALWDVGESIDQACESCHLYFWYPNDVRPF